MMTTPHAEGPRRILIFVFAIPLLVLALLLGAWSMIEDRVGREIRERAGAVGFEVRWDELDAWPWGGVEATNVAVSREGVEWAHFDELLVDVRWFHRQTLDLQPPIQRVEIRGGRVTPPNPLAEGAPDSLDGADGGEGRITQVVKMFGGAPPDVEFEDVTLDVVHLGLPIREVSVTEFRTDYDDDGWVGRGKVRFDSDPASPFHLPDSAVVESRVRSTDDGWAPPVTRLTFAQPATADIKGHSVAVRGVALHGASQASVTEISVAPFGTIDEITVSPARAIAQRDPRAFDSIHIRGAKLDVPAGMLGDDMPGALRAAQAEGDGADLDTRLQEAWDRAFATASEVTVQLQERLPRRVVLEDSSLSMGDQRIDEIDALWFGGPAPRWSVRGKPAEDGRPYGMFTVTADMGSEARIIARARDVDLRRFVERSTGLDLPVAGTVDAELELSQDTFGARPFAGTVTVRDVSVEHARIAAEPITIPAATYRFEGRHRPDAPVGEAQLLGNRFGHAGVPGAARRGVFEIDQGILQVGDVSAELTFEIHGLAAMPEKLPGRVDLRLDLPPTDVDAIWQALPTALKGPLSRAKFRGQVSWELDVEAPLYNLSNTRWRSDLQVPGFRVVDLPRPVDVRRLLRGGRFVLDDPAVGFERTIEIPPMRSDRDPKGRTPRPPWKDHEPSGEAPCGDYVYVPLDYISPFMPDGVLTTEDGSFFRHDGFNFRSLRDAMERNVEEGRFVRGASTISMQLVKNLFLEHEKTLGRKVREAFLVWLMESIVNVPKTRILEVYLNVIEYGPAVFGIHDAALYFFGKRPSELSVGEVAWFISTLPNPKGYHRYFEGGAISDGWWDKMKFYIDAMYRRGRIDEYELLTAKVERPRFRPKRAGCTDSLGLNDPHRFADQVEYQRKRMRDLRVVHGLERSEVLRAGTEPVMGPYYFPE